MSHIEDMACLLDIELAAQAIASFVEGMDESAFRKDKKTQSAVQHQIMIIGEASKHLAPSFRASHAHIPWNAIARMRDRLIHGYGTVDLGIVWTTAIEGIPDLIRAISECRDKQ